MKRIGLILSGLLLPFAALAGTATFQQVRELADQGKDEMVDIFSNCVFTEDVCVRKVATIDQDLYLQGYVVGCTKNYPRNENLDVPMQAGSKSAILKNVIREAYIESLDGQYGFRLLFNHASDAKKAFNLFSKVELSLKGTTVYCENGAYVIAGLKLDHVRSEDTGVEENLPSKVRRICELTDRDLFTWVTVADCEFPFKGGAFLNVSEAYMPKSKTGRYLGNGWMDGWLRLVSDSGGNTLYLGLSGKMKDRRIGSGVPQGSGTVSGVLTNTYSPRYGAVREYTLRPPSLYEIRFAPQGEPLLKTLAAWDWNRKSEGIIPAEYGRAMMTCDVPGKIVRYLDMDNPSNDTPNERPDSRGEKGTVKDGALGIDAKTSDWWDWQKDEPRSLIVAFSTMAVRGDVLAFAWTFSAGRMNQQTSCWYPSWWQVSWSEDGEHFTPAGPEVQLQSLPYSSGKQEGKNYETSAEAGIGYTEHLVCLPSSLLGKKRIFVRLSPSRKVASDMSYLHRDHIEITPDMDKTCYINFGEIRILYR